MRHMLGIGLVGVIMALIAGCATKDFVRETVGQKETQINQRITAVEGRVTDDAQRLAKVDSRVTEEAQRIGKVEGRVTEEAQRIEGMGFRVKNLETSVEEVGRVAKGAQGRADSAFAKAGEVDERLSRLWSSRNARSTVDSVQVLFGFDRSTLTDGAQTALLTVARELKDNPRLTVDLLGYTDQVGTREYNVQLSQRRVEAVRRFLVSQGVDMARIHSVGLGQAPRTDSREAPAQQRRVSVNVMAYGE